MEIELDIKFENYSPSGSFSGPLIIKNKTTLAFGTQIVGLLVSQRLLRSKD